MAKTTIKFRFNPTEIDYAIRKIEQYKKMFLFKCEKLVRALTREGIEIASVQVAQLDAIDTGKLLTNVGGYFDTKSGVGIIKADTPYAIYVEFGTGVVGKQSPHPKPKGYKYDVNNHGDKGWLYYDENSGEFKWTKGFKSRPFMYNTARKLEKECAKIAVEVFGR